MSVYGTSHSGCSKSASSYERRQLLISKSSHSNHSSLISTKPVDVFFVWYSELCRRQNTSPICAIRTLNNKNSQVLRFLADRIKIEDWQPIITALRLDTSLHVISIHSRLHTQEFLESADTEEKVKKIKKWFGAICTKYVMKNLVKSIVSCLKRSTVLTCLELSGLHITCEMLGMICMALPYNTSLKYISFKNCEIGDEGCNDICGVLHTVLNIETIDLSGCGLGLKSCEYLAKLIRYQQINRYCESWHTSLRYEEPLVNNMAGMRRISINNNPNIGDAGLDMILYELMDDLWIKALDMQRCNVTENMARRILDVLEYSKSLEVADFRHNNLLPMTLERILNVLKAKQSDYETGTEYNWCYTTTSISGDTCPSMSSFLPPKIATKPAIKVINNRIPLKRQVTLPVLALKPLGTLNNIQEVQNEGTKVIRLRTQVRLLQEQINIETAKRKEAEQKSEMLQIQINTMLEERKKHSMLKEFKNMEQYLRKLISFVRENGDEAHVLLQNQIQNTMQQVQSLAQYYEAPSVTTESSIITEFTSEASTLELTTKTSSQLSEDDEPVRDIPEQVGDHTNQDNYKKLQNTDNYKKLQNTACNTSTEFVDMQQSASETKSLSQELEEIKDVNDPLPKVKESINLNKKDMYQHMPNSIVASNGEDTRIETQELTKEYSTFESEVSSVTSMPTVRENLRWKIHNMFQNMTTDYTGSDDAQSNHEVHFDVEEHENSSAVTSSAISSARDSAKFHSLREMLEKLLNECSEDDITAMRSLINDQSKSN